MPVSNEEARRLVQITRRSKDPVRLRRAIVVLASTQGRSVQEVASLLHCTEPYMRSVIHAFNEQGFGALDPKWSGGRIGAFDEPTKERIVRIALSRPQDFGEPFTCWSILKLRDYLLKTKIVAEISTETLRQILRGRDVRFQRTKTWKQSNDADYEAKKNRILALYDAAQEGGRVICVDEFGPLNLHPRAGRGWGRKGHPSRLRATFNRLMGVRHLFGALDPATGQIIYRIRTRKRWSEFLAFLTILRARYTERLYIVVDNFSPYLKTEVATWAAANNVEVVFTPTNASFLNWIECEFASLRYFVLNGSDYHSHAEQGRAIRDYLRWRNAHAAP